MAGMHAWQGDMHGRGCAWQGGHVWQRGGMHGKGAGMAGGMHGGCMCGGGTCVGGGGGMCGIGEGACMAGEMAITVGSMHPTGMHSCLCYHLISWFLLNS